MITARYRTDYDGEFIVTQSTWSGGKKRQKREWVANPIKNQHISGRAVCIASDHDLPNFDYTRLQRHRGGLLGTLDRIFSFFIHHDCLIISDVWNHHH
jgi:hypothetical protein